MQVRLIFGEWVGGQLLVAREVLPGFIDVAQRFVEQPQLPFGQGEFGRQLVRLIECRQRPVVFPFRESAICRGIQQANLHPVLVGQSQERLQVGDPVPRFPAVQRGGRHLHVFFQEAERLRGPSIAFRAIRQIEGCRGAVCQRALKVAQRIAEAGAVTRLRIAVGVGGRIGFRGRRCGGCGTGVGEPFFHAGLIFQRCLQPDALGEAVGANDSFLVGVICGQPGLAGSEERQQLLQLLLLLWIPGTGFGLPQVFERFGRVARLVVAEREIVREYGLEGLELHGILQQSGGLLEFSRFVQLAGVLQRILQALPDLVVQPLDRLRHFLHFDQRLRFGVPGARLRQLSGLLQFGGFRGYRLDLGFQFFLLGLFQIVRCPSGRDQSNHENDVSHTPPSANQLPGRLDEHMRQIGPKRASGRGIC